MANRSSELNILPKIPNEIVSHTTIKSSYISCDTEKNMENFQSTKNKLPASAITVPLKIDQPKIRTDLTISPINSNNNNIVMINKWQSQIDKLFKKIQNSFKSSSQNNTFKNPLPKRVSNTSSIMIRKTDKPKMFNMKPFQPFQRSIRRLPLPIRFGIFLTKLTLATATVCGTIELGMWGSVEESNRAAANIYEMFTGQSKSKGLDYNRFKNNIMDTYNTTIRWSSERINEFPETTTKFYNFTSNYIQRKFKS